MVEEGVFLVDMEGASPTVVLEGWGRAGVSSFTDLEGASPTVVLGG